MYIKDTSEICKKHCPAILSMKNMLCTMGPTMLSLKAAKLRSEGYTTEQIDEILKPEIDILNKLFEERESK